MNTNDIREIIREKIAEERRTNELNNQMAASIGQKTALNTIEFVENYVNLTPNLIDKVYAEAKQQNLLNHFQPIFNIVFNYWLEEYDLIPDHLGLVGICDDAYMSLSLMHLIANTKVLGKGRLLSGLDLREINKNMSVLLGLNISSQLDAIVNDTYHSVTLQDSLSSLLNLVAGGMSFVTPFSGIQNTLDHYRMKETIDTQLGALGIF